MSKNKNQFRDAIEPTQDAHEQFERAIIGSLHHMGTVYDAVNWFMYQDQPPDPVNLTPHAYSREHAEKDLLRESEKAIRSGNTDFFVMLAKLVEHLKESQISHVLEAELAALRIFMESVEKFDPNKKDPRHAFVKDWPWTATKLSNYVLAQLGLKYSTTTIRQASKRIGIPIAKDKKGPLPKAAKKSRVAKQ